MAHVFNAQTFLIARHVSTAKCSFHRENANFVHSASTLKMGPANVFCISCSESFRVAMCGRGN